MVSEEAEAQYARLRYVLSQACNDGLVERAELWPGVHSIFALRYGVPVPSLHPHQRPKKTKRSPAPFVHAASREVRERFKEAYRIFSEAFRAAAEALKGGQEEVRFPEGSFPPGLPFVPVPLLEPG